jgi:carbonic anhydrase
MKFQAPATLALLAAVVASSIPSFTAAAKWGYHHHNESRTTSTDDELSPDEWGLVYPSCNGTRQSPIDIETASVKHEARAEGCFMSAYDTVGLSFSGECKSFTLEALEDSFHWNVANDSTCAVHVASSGSTFKLAQFHMHMTSEHTVDGATHAGEAHFVHKETGGGNGVVVVAAFLDTDDAVSLNPWISDVWSSLGKVNETVQIAYPYAEVLDQQIASGPVYNYPGSLTTPPCSEIVDWWVLGAPVKMTSNDLNSLAQQLETRETADDGDDARPTQPLNGRTVLAY